MLSNWGLIVFRSLALHTLIALKTWSWRLWLRNTVIPKQFKFTGEREGGFFPKKGVQYLKFTWLFCTIKERNSSCQSVIHARLEIVFDTFDWAVGIFSLFKLFRCEVCQHVAKNAYRLANAYKKEVLQRGKKHERKVRPFAFSSQISEPEFVYP